MPENLAFPNVLLVHLQLCITSPQPGLYTLSPTTLTVQESQPPAPSIQRIPSSLNLPVLDISCKGNCTSCGLLYLAFSCNAGFNTDQGFVASGGQARRYSEQMTLFPPHVLMHCCLFPLADSYE